MLVPYRFSSPPIANQEVSASHMLVNSQWIDWVHTKPCLVVWFGPIPTPLIIYSWHRINTIYNIVKYTIYSWLVWTYPSEKWWSEIQLGWLFHSQLNGKSCHPFMFHQPETPILSPKVGNPATRMLPDSRVTAIAAVAAAAGGARFWDGRRSDFSTLWGWLVTRSFMDLQISH